MSARTPRTERVGRNDPCPCGSGKKYKNCHESRAGAMSPGQRLLYALLGIVLVSGIIFAISQAGHQEKAAGVWSPEHGHYH